MLWGQVLRHYSSSVCMGKQSNNSQVNIYIFRRERCETLAVRFFFTWTRLVHLSVIIWTLDAGCAELAAARL